MTSDVPDGRPIAAVRDHLANERTMLAWLRTSITVIGLGFLVGRLLVGPEAATPGLVLAVLLVLVGTATALLGLRRFVLVEHQIDRASYRPSACTHIALTMAIAVVGVLLIGYLVLWPPSL